MATNKSIYGRDLQQNVATKELACREIPITPVAVNATIAVAAEVTDVRQIAVALFDGAGQPITYCEEVEIVMFSTAAANAYVVTGGSTGIALGAAGFGAIQTIVAKKRFQGLTKNDGTLSLQWTDTGTETFNVGIKLPNGRIVYSGQFANA